MSFLSPDERRLINSRTVPTSSQRFRQSSRGFPLVTEWQLVWQPVARFVPQRLLRRSVRTGTLFKAAIFDMDGVLIDSEPLWQRAEVAVFGALGVPLTPERCVETRGLRIAEVVGHWYERYPWRGASVDHVAARLLSVVSDLIRDHGRPLAGALAAVELAYERCGPLAVASSSPQRLIESVVNALDIRDRFAVLHSAESEPRGKPDPGVYLTTARKLGVGPAACVAFEDSIAGVLAAKAAGMTCVALPERALRGDPRLSAADLLIATLEEFDQRMWENLERTLERT